MSVIAVSAQVRDQFLSLEPFYPARRRTATVADRGLSLNTLGADRALIGWHPFGQLFVGLATYYAKDEEEGLPSQEFAAWLEYQAMVERERGWWRTVGELQRFVLPRPGPA
jgi:hypothetical protein